MISLLVLVIVIGFGLIAATRWSPLESSFAITAVRAGGWIALTRVALYWVALALYTGHADWRQVAGYGLLVLNAGVELAIVASLTSTRPASASLAVAGAIVLTSAVLGWAWVWIRR